MKLTNKTWPAFAASISTQGDPRLHSEASIDRLMKIFGRNIINVRAPHGKFKAINRCELINFISPESEARVNIAFAQYIERIQKLGREGNFGHFEQLVAFGQYRKASEIEKAPIIKERMLLAVNEGKAAVAAMCFKNGIAKCVRGLINSGVKRDEISLIWGGNDLFNKSRRLDGEQINALIKRISSGEKVPFKLLKQLENQVTETEDEKAEAETEYGEDLRLGSQGPEERQKEIDKFQSGKSVFCLFTFRAGGVGLSLHHTDTDSFGRSVSLRQRRSFLSPTFSAKEFVQGLGRAHRSVFSLSDTEQTILFFKGVEQHVMELVSLKLKCLKKVVASKESWADAIYESRKSKKELESIYEEEQKRIEPLQEDDQQEVDEMETGEEDEEE